jgi:hypothetical protein
MGLLLLVNKFNFSNTHLVSLSAMVTYSKVRYYKEEETKCVFENLNLFASNCRPIHCGKENHFKKVT